MNIEHSISNVEVINLGSPPSKGAGG
jgi:hypothetical protein